MALGNSPGVRSPSGGRGVAWAQGGETRGPVRSSVLVAARGLFLGGGSIRSHPAEPRAHVLSFRERQHGFEPLDHPHIIGITEGAPQPHPAAWPGTGARQPRHRERAGRRHPPQIAMQPGALLTCQRLPRGEIATAYTPVGRDAGDTPRGPPVAQPDVSSRYRAWPLLCMTFSIRSVRRANSSSLYASRRDDPI